MAERYLLPAFFRLRARISHMSEASSQTFASIPMTSNRLAFALIVLSWVSACSTVSNVPTGGTSDAVALPVACPQTASLKLPAGFCATIFADSVGAVRHMVVSAGGTLIANLQAGRNPAVSAIKPGQVALRDNDKDGRADGIQRFGTGGNTGIAIYKDWVYADVGRAIVRYRMNWSAVTPVGGADTVVAGIPGPPGHTARNFTIAPDGAMYVNFGSATNACQEKDRTAGSRGVDPCTELDTRAGVWKFSADRLNQRPSLGNRFATGLRNAIALRVAPGGQLYSIVQGRDQLFGNWSAKFTEQQNAELPAEILVAVNRGDDFGWPYCYYDGIRNRTVLAPEYGGDGTEIGRCATKKNPILGLPAHWSPIDLLFYTGNQFPAKYRNGVFATFHGSWNRAPLPQAGYQVVFIPMVNGLPTGRFEEFANNFTAILDPSKAEHRPAGIAQAPDGSIYISDDAAGRIYRVTYAGSR